MYRNVLRHPPWQVPAPGTAGVHEGVLFPTSTSILSPNAKVESRRPPQGPCTQRRTYSVHTPPPTQQPILDTLHMEPFASSPWHESIIPLPFVSNSTHNPSPQPYLVLHLLCTYRATHETHTNNHARLATTRTDHPVLISRIELHTATLSYTTSTHSFLSTSPVHTAQPTQHSQQHHSQHR